MDNKSGDWPPKGLLSPVAPSTPSTPVSSGLSNKTSIRTDYSITAGFIVPDLACSTISEAESAHSAATSMFAMAHKPTTTTATTTEKPLNNQADLVNQEAQDKIKFSSMLPSESMLETVADLPVFDKDGKFVPFKSLYWVDGRDSKRVMIIFIRNFFCGVCLALVLSIRRRTTDTWIELPGVLTDTGWPDCPIFSTLRHIDPYRRLWFAYTDSVVRGTDKLSIPHIRRPVQEAVQHTWYGEDVEPWDQRAGLYPAYDRVRDGEKYCARFEENWQR